MRPLFALLATVSLLNPGLAFAYVGPGLGAGALGAVVGIVGAVFLGLVAIVWYPFKRLLRNRRNARTQTR